MGSSEKLGFAFVVPATCNGSVAAHWTAHGDPAGEAPKDCSGFDSGALRPSKPAAGVDGPRPRSVLGRRTPPTRCRVWRERTASRESVAR